MPEPVARAEDTVTLDNSPTMAMTSLYGAAIGPIGSDYYLPIFERFEAAGRGTLSWNRSACLYNLNWMIFRRLWGAALVAAGALTGAALVLVALGRLIFDWSPELLYGSLLTCLTLVFLVPGVWGNALLYNHSRAAMMTAVANNKTLAQACAELSQHASSRARFIRILVVNLALIALAGMAYVMLAGNNTPANPEPQAAPAPTRASSPASAAEPVARALAPVASAPNGAASTTAPESKAVSAATMASAEAMPPASSPAQAASAPASAPVAASGSAPASSPAQTMDSAKPAKVPQANPAVPAKLAAPASAPANGFYVNAGLFANSDNARKVLARLQTATLPAVSQEQQTGQGPRTRVRVGPFANRAQAEAAIQQIKALKLDAALAKPSAGD